MVLEANVADMSINAKRAPISPPFNLSKFDLIKSIDKNKIDKAIRYTHKIEKSINKFGYEIENAKRYLVSIKKLLEF